MPRRKSSQKESIPEMQKPSSQQARSVTAGEEPQAQIVQEHREDASASWAQIQDEAAAALGLSALLVDGRQPPALVLSNNNSICRAFQSSPARVSLCDPFCGDAHRRAMSAGTVVKYKCHAGLQCFTMPVALEGRQDLAIIGGRTFVSGSDYRTLAERFRGGELNDLLTDEPFENVIFSEPERLDQLASRIEKAARSLESTFRPVFDAGVIEARLEPHIAAKPAVAEPASFVTERTEPQSDLHREVQRLRVELEHRDKLADSLRHFLERISSRDPMETYQAILSRSKELLKADRASLMVFDEDAREVVLKAATGFSIEEDFSPTRPGEGIASHVIESGQPLLVSDLAQTDFPAAPLERGYRSGSFISYPVSIHGRKIGVLNLTDKRDNSVFDEVDLSLLEIIGPQIAVALERAEWQERATQFQLMSITDPLTGLLNRRYLEERLTEELNRSTRYSYSTSCLMIDIDDFKNYNDRNGHQAGDLALKITAHNLKAALRSADVACRYGGEEFCILLPQTTLTEAGVIAERMRQRVMETEYPHGPSQPLGHVSISIGISTFARNIDTAEKVIAAADRALYRAKSLGKNRIEFYFDDLTSPYSGRL